MKYEVTLYKQGELLYERVDLIELPKNIKRVSVKQERICADCDLKIAKGTRCLTISRKYKGRSWYCDGCSENHVPCEGLHLVGSFFKDNDDMYVFFDEEVTKFNTHKRVPDDTYDERLEEAIWLSSESFDALDW